MMSSARGLPHIAGRRRPPPSFIVPSPVACRGPLSMRPRPIFALLTTLFALAPLRAQSADDIVARYLQRVGGAERVRAIQTLHRSGTFYGGGGFEAQVVYVNKRPNLVREDFS